MICALEVRHNKIANSAKDTTDVFILVYKDRTCFKPFLRTGFKSRLTSKEEEALKRVLDDKHEVNCYSSRREETTWKSWA